MSSNLLKHIGFDLFVIVEFHVAVNLENRNVGHDIFVTELIKLRLINT